MDHEQVKKQVLDQSHDSYLSLANCVYWDHAMPKCFSFGLDATSREFWNGTG